MSLQKQTTKALEGEAASRAHGSLPYLLLGEDAAPKELREFVGLALKELLDRFCHVAACWRIAALANCSC